MPDLWMDVDAALAEVPINTMPLIDDTDFKTIEDALVYNQAGLALVWNFVTTAGAQTATSVTPTTGGGDYDWTDQGTNGLYSVKMPASGGASANNDTEGFGWFSGVATGVLPWRGPIIGFRAAALNNALIDGGDVLDVSVTEIGGVAQSATDLKDFADTGYDPATHKVAGVVLTDTTTTNTDMRGTDNAALAATAISNVDWTAARAGYLDELAAANLPADVDTLLARIVGTILAGNHTAQTGDNYARLGAPTGASVSADIAAILVDTDELQTNQGNWLTADVSALATAAKLLKYVQLLARSDAAIETDNAVELGEINVDGGSGAGDFSAQTDAVEALRDRGDAAWVTGGGSGLSALATGTAQAGAAGTITLAAGASATSSIFVGARVLITSGTGAGQSRMITAYDGGTKVATIGPINWTTNPDATSTYEIQAADSNVSMAVSKSLTGNLADIKLQSLSIIHPSAIALTVQTNGNDYAAYFNAPVGSGIGVGMNGAGTGFAMTGSTAMSAIGSSYSCRLLGTAGTAGYGLQVIGKNADAVNFSVLSGNGDGLQISGLGTGVDLNIPTWLTLISSITTITNRIGAWTGSARNTILGAFQALFRKDVDATVPSDINADLGGGAGTADNTTDSQEALRDRGDTAWVTATSVNVSDKTGFSLAATGLDAIVSTATGTVEIAKAVWDRVLSGATHNIATSAGRRLRAIQDYEGYGGYIWVDTVNGFTGTTIGENGTSTYPVNTWADALTLSAALNIFQFKIAGISTITLSTATTYQLLQGHGYTLALNGQDISGSHIAEATISGIATGTAEAHFHHCDIGTCTLPPCYIHDGVLKGTLTLGGTGTYYFQNNTTDGDFVLDFAAVGADIVVIDRFGGDAEIRNMATGDYLKFHGRGNLTINANCTAGTIDIFGDINIIGAGGGVTINNYTAAGVRAAVGLAAANLDTQLTAVGAAVAAIPIGLKRGVALDNFEFLMVLASDSKTPAPGLTVTATISKDGAAPAATSNAVAEVGLGWYKISLTAAEMTADNVRLVFTAATADQRNIVLRTSK